MIRINLLPAARKQAKSAGGGSSRLSQRLFSLASPCSYWGPSIPSIVRPK